LPLYEYQCAKDGTFEQVRKFSDPPLTACPTCGGPVEKLVSAPAIQFKGTGWYITDYARKSSGGSDSGKEAGGSGKETGGSGKETSSGADKAEKKDAGSSRPAASTSSGSGTPASSGSTDKK
jgi:putative FmdB family regulatory protein